MNMSAQSQSNNDQVSSDLAGAADSPLFTSLATTVIDELRFPSGQVIENVLGGSATYSTVEPSISLGETVQLIFMQVYLALVSSAPDKKRDH